ncbi:UNVERIFIED_CONTAM: hypothetical protein Slati_1102000 [Sesamum latifolium]|uniref:Retrotransposon gag domain-containing protein n=1 Tax=Sesamum latifolium TaxID=2727402 RepID=A0AAW2XBT4_9LAMI
MEELHVHFRAPSHLPAYDGTTDQAKHIRKFENAALLHSKKYQKSIISLFGAKQEDNETLRAYVQHFNTTILKVLTAHQEVLVSAFTQGLCGGPFFESLAKKPVVDYLDVLTRAEKYMNLEDALLVRRSSRQRENEFSSSSRSKEQAEDL